MKKKETKKQLEYVYKVMKYGHECHWDFASSFQKGGYQGTSVDVYAFVICHGCGKVKEVKIEL